MIKKLVSLLALLLLFFTAAYSQTLFTYGTKAVSKDEFLKAFNKTPNPDSTRKAALQQYLDLYINFKLKVQAAYDEHLDKDENYKTESENFKSQLVENKINEQANISELIQQAFDRSAKDIHVSEIFIAVPAGTDSTNALQQINNAYKDLQNGKSFEDVVAAYSSDESLKQSNGDLGYITVFTLPYEIENIVYTLQPGQYSQPYRSSIGYHIFRDDDERPAVGKRTISEILFATPASFSDEQKQAVAQKADSIYRLIKNGAGFDDMQQQFSDPSSSSDENSGTFEVAVGQYSSDFEQQVFALKNQGDISPVFQTAFGYHIVKLDEIKPASKDPNDVIARSDIEQRVQNDNRLATAKKNLVYKWLNVIQYKTAAYNINELWQYTDSALQGKSTKNFKNINQQTILFSFAKQNYSAGDWTKFVLQKNAMQTMKSYPALMKDFINTSCNNYYREHLTDYDESLKQEMKEFDEANLLFAAMDKHVWSKAGADSTGLKQYYSTNKSKYMWGPSVSALVITVTTKQLADEVAAKIKLNPLNWRNITGAYDTRVNADSSRFEQNQFPVQQTVSYEKGFISTPEKNTNDSSYTFIYITDVYPQAEQRSFDDARGMVINDYQQVIEDKWIASLKQKYPVKVNEAVFKSIE